MNTLRTLTLPDFLNQTAGSDPVPGGGSISALCGSTAAALTQMVAQLTIGKKKYADVESEMRQIATAAEKIREELLIDIDRDSDAYNVVFDAFKLPKESEEEKAHRSAAIQEATKKAAVVPMEVARRTFGLLPLIKRVVESGNQNAITDGCVAMMCARTAILGALLNVRINLSSLKDQTFVDAYASEAREMEEAVESLEKEILSLTYSAL